MSEYPSYVDYVVDNDTIFNANDMNKILSGRDKRTEYLKETLDNAILKNQRIRIEKVSVSPGTENFRVVRFNGTKWEAMNGAIPIGETLSSFPLGILTDLSDVTGTINMVGYLENMNASITETGEVVLGVPYFMSMTTPGKITNIQPRQSIYIGTFVAADVFLVSIQNNTSSHIHRRHQLVSTSWQNNITYLTYPLSAIGQLPLPYEGAVLVMNNRYMPKYGPYTIDVDGLKIMDISFFETMMGLTPGTLYSTISNSSYMAELFWSDPRTISMPGVMSLSSSTGNLTIENNVPGQPSNTGNLRIKNIPQLIEKTGVGGSTCVKNIIVKSTGELEIMKGPVVEKILAGSNVTVSQTQGSVTVNSQSGIYREREFGEVFLQGALSKIYPNTIVNYIEFPHTVNSSAIFKFVTPTGISQSSPVYIYCSYFGLEQIEGYAAFKIRCSLIDQLGAITRGSEYSVLDLPVTVALKPAKILIKELNAVMPDTHIFIQTERDKSNGDYNARIGIVSLVIRYAE